MGLLESASAYLGDSKQAKYIKKYVKEIGGNKIVTESDYVDKDYLIDYQKYYSRAFTDEPRTTIRIHYFGGTSTTEQLSSFIFDPNSTDELKNEYLGFSIVKPVKNIDKNPIIGRTILKPYPVNAADHTRSYISTPQRANLFGHELPIESLPFQSQDVAVGACASAALWAASHQLFNLFQIPKNSLYEITEDAYKMVTPESRAFPSEGLTIQQICAFMRMRGLELEIFNIANIDKLDGKGKEFIARVITSFVNAGIPIIAGLTLIEKIMERREEEDPEYHAVVITGLSPTPEGQLREIYVHDDQVGPYARVSSTDGFRTWKYRRTDGKTPEPDEIVGWSKYERITLDTLVVPLYHKIRLPFMEVWNLWVGLDKKEMIVRKELLFFEVGKYKKRLLGLQFKEKERVLSRSMPRFLWAYKTEDDNGIITEILIDATAPFPKRIEKIEYI